LLKRVFGNHTPPTKVRRGFRLAQGLREALGSKSGYGFESYLYTITSMTLSRMGWLSGSGGNGETHLYHRATSGKTHHLLAVAAVSLQVLIGRVLYSLQPDGMEQIHLLAF